MGRKIAPTQDDVAAGVIVVDGDLEREVGYAEIRKSGTEIPEQQLLEYGAFG
jgi:hypothetical protein